MRNRQAEANQLVKAYLVRANQEWAFWCRTDYAKNITQEIGQPFNNGNRTLITESNLEFRIHDKVRINGEQLMIDDIQYEMKDNKNALRGSPSYIKTLVMS